LFAYCSNNPIIRSDPTGACFWCGTPGIAGENLRKTAGCLTWLTSRYNICECTDNDVTIYVVTSSKNGDAVNADDISGFNTGENAAVVIDKRTATDKNGNPNPDMQVVDSYKIKNIITIYKMSKLMLAYNAVTPTTASVSWDREAGEMTREWVAHNALHKIFESIGMNNIANRLQHVDLDNDDWNKGILGLYGDYLGDFLSNLF